MNQRIHTYFILLFSLIFSLTSFAQNRPAKSKALPTYSWSNKIFNLQFLYNSSMPGGDMGERFGQFSSLGFGGSLKTKSNWLFSAELNYLFGKRVKEDHLLDNIVNGGGYIASTNGTPASYGVGLRGYTGFLKVGRVVPLTKKTGNSGLLFQAGAGFLLHRINFAIPANDVPQLENGYERGYDRQTFGIAMSEFVGYYFHSRNRLVNFYAGFDFVQGFTKNTRGYLYDQNRPDTGPKHDQIYSFRLGWMIPIYLTTKTENEFYFK